MTHHPFMMTFHRIMRESSLTLALAMPIVIGQLGQNLIGLADSIMLGRVGVMPLAASAFVQSLFVIVLIGFMGVLTPVTVLASRSYGANQPDESAEILRHGLWISLFLGMLGVAALMLCLPFIGHMGQSAEVAQIAGPFYILITWSLIPVLIFRALKNYCEALAAPTVPMLFMIAGVLLNIFLNWILIFGNWGSPALGLTGAGIATFLSRLFITVALFAFVVSSQKFREHLPSRWMQPPEWGRIVSMMKLGLPIGGQLLVEVGAFAISTLMLGWISPQAIAAHQIVLNCVSSTFMIPLGISMAASIRVGHHIGAKKLQHLRSIGISSLGVTILFMGTSCLLYLAYGRDIARAFIADEATVALAAGMFVLGGIFQIPDGVQVVGMGLLRGLRDVAKPLVIAFVSYWCITLPLGYIFAFHTSTGAVGMWYGFLAGLTFAALLLTVRFFWKTSEKRLSLKTI